MNELRKGGVYSSVHPHSSKWASVAVLLLAAAMAPIASRAQQGPYKFKLNSSYKYLMLMNNESIVDVAGQSMSTSVNMKMQLGFVADSLLPAGDLRLRMSIDSVKMTVEGPQGVQDMSEQVPHVAQKFVIHPNGKVVDRDTIENAGAIGGAASMMGGRESNFPVLDPSQLVPGGHWVDKGSDTSGKGKGPAIFSHNLKYTVKGPATLGKRACLEISFEGTMQSSAEVSQEGADMSMSTDGTQSGTIFFDTERGILLLMTSKFTQDMTMNQGGGESSGAFAISGNGTSRFEYLPD